MKAIRFHEHGGPDVLRCDELPDAEPGPGQVRLRVHASALNHLDVDIREGSSRMTVEVPHIPGFEVVGSIDSIGPGVDGALRVGQRVIPWAYDGWMPGRALGGGYADHVIASAEHVVPVPDGIGDAAAAAVQMAFATAWHCLLDRGGLRAGETVLVTSASGGVASAAIQLARFAGARVLATSSSQAKLARAIELGADEAIDYTREDVPARVAELTDGRGVDLALDHTGGAQFASAVASLRRGGRLVVCGGHAQEVVPLDVVALFRSEISVIGSGGHSKEELRKALELVAAGHVEPVVAATFPLDDAVAATRALEARRHFGKVVLMP